MKNVIEKISRKLFFTKASFQVIFPHVPKCAGNAVIKSIQAAADRNRINISFDLFDGAACNLLASSKSVAWWQTADIVFAYKSIAGNANILTGHAPFYEQTKNQISADKKIVTVLRNPVDRWISNYIYDSYKPQKLGGRFVEIGEYLSSGAAILGGNYYTVFFSNGNLDGISPQDVEQSIRFLKKFDAVGCTERMLRFNKLLGEICSMQINSLEVNTSPKPGLADEIKSNKPTMSKIRKLCENDIRVYEEVMAFWS
jgi:hypothetical protein